MKTSPVTPTIHEHARRSPVRCLLVAVSLASVMIVSGCATTPGTSGQRLGDDAQTHEIVERVSRSLNATLPRDYGNGITWVRSWGERLEVVNELSVTPEWVNRLESGEMDGAGENPMERSLCADANVRELMSRGVTFRMELRDERGLPVRRTRLTRDDC
ncbi:MAG: hypothetical protein ACR2RL_16840 [Gammaproteobacteria bacterium]